MLSPRHGCFLFQVFSGGGGSCRAAVAGGTARLIWAQDSGAVHVPLSVGAAKCTTCALIPGAESPGSLNMNPGTVIRTNTSSLVQGHVCIIALLVEQVLSACDLSKVLKSLCPTTPASGLSGVPLCITPHSPFLVFCPPG